MQKSLDRYTINAKLTDRRYFECLFIITLSRKNIHIRGSWKSREAVEYATLEWVEWLNNRRILEPKEKNSPAKLEKLYYTELDITVTATGLTYFFLRWTRGCSIFSRQLQRESLNKAGYQWILSWHTTQFSFRLHPCLIIQRWTSWKTSLPWETCCLHFIAHWKTVGISKGRFVRPWLSCLAPWYRSHKKYIEPDPGNNKKGWSWKIQRSLHNRTKDPRQYFEVLQSKERHSLPSRKLW